MNDNRYSEYIYYCLAIAAGFLSGLIIYAVFNSIMGYDWSYWSEMLRGLDFFSWAMIIAMFAVPVVSGIKQCYNGESLWRVLLFPILAGASAAVMVFLTGMIIYLFTSGEILKIILGIGIFLTLAAPATKVLVIVFE